MKISWWIERRDEKGAEPYEDHLFATEGEMPRIGDIVYLNNNLGFGGRRSAKAVVIDAYHSINANGFGFDCIEYPENMDKGADRFAHAYRYVEEVTGGKVSSMDKDHNQFIYTLHEAQVIVRLVDEDATFDLSFKERAT